MAASLLVLRPPGSLSRHPAGNGVNVTFAFDLRAQACLRLPRDGRGDGRHWLARLSYLGPSYVRERHESVCVGGVFIVDVGNWRAVCGQDVQLARHDLARA